VAKLRTLVLVLGDQLDRSAAAFDGFDAQQDAVWMAEASEESTHVWSSKMRIALFLSSMRHFAQALRDEGVPLHYTAMDDSHTPTTLAGELAATLRKLKPQQLTMTAPGDWRVLKALRGAAQAHGVPLDVREDRHFFSTVQDFRDHAEGRKSLRLEYFYRELRERHDVLMDADKAGGRGKPCGGQWNFDADNREAFPAAGPGLVPKRATFKPDSITQSVLALVQARFADHPGETASFAWPVTRAQALQSLALFIQERLPNFGRYQDAMWPGEAWLHHSHLGASMNLKLIHPREVVAAAEKAYRDGHADLASVEGFIRQILGWREYVRGIYWTQMPDYAARNELQAKEPLPAFFWTGDTDMACLRDALAQTLEHGYAHHIQRLMITGLYALMLGVDPRQVHGWYLSVYVDAVEWVELPNVLGMSQYADGGVMASKPYVATGKYIDRMSPHCKACRYNPAKRVGDDACPYTTLYWDFLLRHEARMAANPRMVFQVKNIKNVVPSERERIQARAADIRQGLVGCGQPNDQKTMTAQKGLVLE
jgi:deoxyribodipyrimidine photolyase-related protein